MAHFDPEDLKEIGGGPIAWMASHPVAANLLMLVCLLGGFFMLTQTTKEVFPTFALDTVSVRMSYPGASPEEVEQAVVLALEEAVRDVEGLGEITSSAREGSASLTAEVLDPDDMMRVQQDIKTAVDQISTFPDEAENLTVSINSRRRDVMELALYGDVSEHVLREAAEMLREKLQAHPDIGPVELSGAKGLEIHIEVSQENLRRYNISLPDISAKIRTIALELGGGSLKTDRGEILVRMSERRDNAIDFKDIPILTLENGSKVLLGDIATISEGFEDTNNSATFNGKPAILMDVYRIGEQTPSGVATAVYAELEQMSSFLPEELQIGIADDDSKLFEQRAGLMLKNGFWGLLLVMIFLALFLDVRLAFWVAMGIPISFLGAFLIFPATDFTINIVSMFAFIIALGIVVDDAIVSGENIYHYRQKGYKPLAAAVAGAREIAIPIVVSVITNMIAFLPLMFIPGIMGKVFSVIPVVVVGVFLLSLIECLFILPSHLTFRKANTRPTGLLSHFIQMQKGFNSRFEIFVTEHYGAFMTHVIRHRYLTFALFMAVLIAIGGYVFSGRMGMQLFPRVESDYAFAAATLKVGAPEEKINAVSERLVGAAEEVIAENGGAQLSTGIYATISDNSTEVRAFLTEPGIRPITTAEFTRQWREKVGELAGVDTLGFQSNRGGPGSGAALTVELSHRSTEVLDQAAADLAAALAEFPVTEDVDDGSAQGKKQYDFKMRPLGYTLGLTTQDVARQVRAAFYGSEAFKQQRGRDEIRVLVRLPEAQRSSEYTLQNLMIQAPDGSDVLLRDVVYMTEGRAYTTINRRDGRRNIQVTAGVEPPEQANRVINAIKSDTLPQLQQRYPGLSYSFEGRQAEIRDSVTSLFWGLLAVLFIMYALLAVLFGSYAQPFMVLVAIPFSAVGAVLGHFLMGYSLSVMSLFGMMALAGVVVNGSLVLIDFANRKREKGMPMVDALLEASGQRFRPILLTTLTTFVGLAPMIFETSRQAKFLIPMAISLGYGILFAIFVTLILIPALYMIIEDLKSLSRRFRGHGGKAAES
ncbi:MAG: efflux RND transporter permease subunit [Rhodospirillales bacterium]|nr:efflux RND transporter permease subunit [Rhodospirillales bacterium]MCB9994896.1 efflux RND transporter permease subunit [Rhodospirillales bacterium]